MIRKKEVTTFKYGIIDSIEEQSIPAGSASSSSNFITKGDKVVLAGGNFNLGGTIEDTDENRGVHVAFRRDGVEILMRKRGRKLEIYDADADTWSESGTDLFPVAAVDDEMSFANYDSLAGAQVFLSSPNSSIYKIMIANPLNPKDMGSTDYRGRIFATQNRLVLVSRKGTNLAKDETGVYISFIDAQNYTTVTAESIGTGDGATDNFTGTLASITGIRTGFGVTITDGVETFVDDYSGNLIGSLGGTGTINYATGAYDVTFNTAPILSAAITADYQWEDSTDEGVCDFNFTTPTRVAGEGDVFRQDSGGGKAQAVRSFLDHEFCFHERKTWDLVLSTDDTNATNLPYRDKVGIPNWRACASDGEGIYYIDDTDKNNPVLRQMTLAYASTEIIPRALSLKKDLSNYLFDKCWMLVNDQFVIFGARTLNSIKNDTVFIYDKTWKSIDQFPLFSSCGTLFNGSLVLGDSLSSNTYLAFNGYDDNGSQIQGHFATNLYDLDEERLKKVKEIWVEGEIQKNQIIKVSALTDHGSYSTIGYIRGNGNYVDSTALTIGSNTIGRFTIGGRDSETITAFHYSRPIKLALDKFREIKLKFEVAIDPDDATKEGIGYFSITKITYQDIRLKQKKLPAKYRVA